MDTKTVTPRIAPLEPPYSPEVSERLAKMMPSGAPPIALFRTWVKNLPMAQAIGPWGGYELSSGLSLSMRDREIVIDRTCARCGCEYEWGVHVAFFAEPAGLNTAQVASLSHGGWEDDCWADERDQLLIRAVDALHDESDIGDELWAELAVVFTEANLLDLLLLCGWYHAISFAARAARVPLEEFAPRFSSLSTA